MCLLSGRWRRRRADDGDVAGRSSIALAEQELTLWPRNERRQSRGEKERSRLMTYMGLDVPHSLAEVCRPDRLALIVYDSGARGDE